MQRQFFQFIGDLDAFIDLLELKPQKVFVKFGTERGLPVDQAAHQEFNLFLVQAKFDGSS